MPTTRKRVGRFTRALGPVELEHLRTGPDHLLAGDCWLCAHGLESARALWPQARAAALEDWERLGFPFPTLAECVYEGAKLPPCDPGWRDLHRWQWQSIADELARIDVSRVTAPAA